MDQGGKADRIMGNNRDEGNSKELMVLGGSTRMSSQKPPRPPRRKSKPLDLSNREKTIWIVKDDDPEDLMTIVKSCSSRSRCGGSSSQKKRQIEIGGEDNASKRNKLITNVDQDVNEHVGKSCSKHNERIENLNIELQVLKRRTSSLLNEECYIKLAHGSLKWRLSYIIQDQTSPTRSTGGVSSSRAPMAVPCSYPPGHNMNQIEFLSEKIANHKNTLQQLQSKMQQLREEICSKEKERKTLLLALQKEGGYGHHEKVVEEEEEEDDLMRFLKGKPPRGVFDSTMEAEIISEKNDDHAMEIGEFYSTKGLSGEGSVLPKENELQVDIPKDGELITVGLELDLYSQFDADDTNLFHNCD